MAGAVERMGSWRSWEQTEAICSVRLPRKVAWRSPALVGERWIR